MAVEDGGSVANVTPPNVTPANVSTANVTTTSGTTGQEESREPQEPRPGAQTAPEHGSPYRQRLLDALAESIAGKGYRGTTVADIVRLARTSRRTFYEHFADKETCYSALLTQANEDVIASISAAVDPKAPAETQIRQAITTWVVCSDARPALTLSWIRDSPALGADARHLQRELQEGFVALLQELTGTAELKAVGVEPVSREIAIILLGGLRDLIATTVEDGGRMADITEVAVQAATALLGQPVPGTAPPA
jgi:AcrR family transcriptional regulator